MKWRLYKKDDPNTWPRIDCPMVVYNHEAEKINICKKYIPGALILDNGGLIFNECYYAYIGFVPSGYKTLYPIKCMCEYDDRCAYEDDGYCMDYENDCACEYKKETAEYFIEENRIWKEFE